jgi:hypothetical protein
VQVAKKSPQTGEITRKSVATYKIGVDTIKIGEGIYKNMYKSIYLLIGFYLIRVIPKKIPSCQ